MLSPSILEQARPAPRRRLGRRLRQLRVQGSQLAQPITQLHDLDDDHAGMIGEQDHGIQAAVRPGPARWLSRAIDESPGAADIDPDTATWR